MKTIKVLSQKLFDIYCANIGLNDSNIEDNKDYAYISIIGTSECLNYYLDEGDTCHYFSSDHENVINLEFDDIPEDEMEYDGHIFTGLTMNQAKKLFKFIEKNIDKNFIIHCRAGKSRSQAVGSFIMNFYPDFTSDTILPFCNQDVYRKLSRCYYKKYNPEYET